MRVKIPWLAESGVHIRNKICTVKRVIQTFGFMELFKSVIRKFTSSNKDMELEYSPPSTQIGTSDDVMKHLVSIKVFSGNSEIVLAEFDEIFQKTIGSKRKGFFDSNYDVGYELSFLLFSLVRLLRPKLVIETGVAAGVSSTIMLSALQRNNYGRLLSIDITDRVGELIPVPLKERWCLEILKGINLKNQLRSIITGTTDEFIFIHDSNHALEWQKFELSLILSTGRCKFFLIDDVSPELLEFLKSKFKRENLFLLREVGKTSAFAYL